MKARRSLPGRTDARLPRAVRRTRPAAALLLSFALLCTAVSLGAPAPHGHRGPLRSPSAASGISLAEQCALPSPADAAARSAQTPPRGPRPPHPRVRPQRSIAALNQESAATAVTLVALPACLPIAKRTVAIERVSQDPPSIFPSYASNASRTRGQPASGC